MDSILESIKELLGIQSDYTHFDRQIIEHINAVFMTLNQLGVGPEDPVLVTTSMDTWSSKFGSIKSIASIKSYVYLRVRMLFDPPTSSFVLDSMKEQAREFEWRLREQVEFKKKEV